MKKLFFLCCVGMWLFSCKAQKIYPIDYRWDNAPNGAYFKDSGTILNDFVGIWHASYNNRTITLYITKELEIPFELLGKTFKKDELLVRFEIKDANSNIEKTTVNQNFLTNSKHKITSWVVNTSQNKYLFLYNGGDCSVGNGGIFISKVSPTQIKWNYVPERVTISDDTCPHPRDLNVYLPTVENLIFTKQ